VTVSSFLSSLWAQFGARAADESVALRVPEVLPLAGALSLPWFTVLTPEGGEAVLSSTTLGIVVRASVVYKWPRGECVTGRRCGGAMVKLCGGAAVWRYEQDAVKKVVFQVAE